MNKGLIGVGVSVGILAGLFIMFEVIYGGLGMEEPLNLKGIGTAGFLGWATFYAAGGEKAGFVSGFFYQLNGHFVGYRNRVGVDLVGRRFQLSWGLCRRCDRSGRHVLPGPY